MIFQPTGLSVSVAAVRIWRYGLTYRKSRFEKGLVLGRVAAFSCVGNFAERTKVPSIQSRLLLWVRARPSFAI